MQSCPKESQRSPRRHTRPLFPQSIPCRHHHATHRTAEQWPVGVVVFPRTSADDCMRVRQAWATTREGRMHECTTLHCTDYCTPYSVHTLILVQSPQGATGRQQTNGIEQQADEEMTAPQKHQCHSWRYLRWRRRIEASLLRSWFDPCSPGLLAQQRLGARTPHFLHPFCALYYSALGPLSLRSLGGTPWSSPVLQNRRDGRCLALHDNIIQSRPRPSAHLDSPRPDSLVIKVGCRRTVIDGLSMVDIDDGDGGRGKAARHAKDKRPDQTRPGMHCSAHLGAKKKHTKQVDNKGFTIPGMECLHRIPQLALPVWG